MRSAGFGALILSVVALVAGCSGASAVSTSAVASTTTQASTPASPGLVPSPTGSRAAAPSPTATPTPSSTATPRSTLGDTPTAAPTATPPAATATIPTEWHLDLYWKEGMRYEYPDPYSCTATSVQITLNFIVRDGGQTIWSPDTSYAKQEEIFAYERSHMTLPAWINGSDPHGARNALNYFGWGSMEAGVYKDVAFGTFGAAAKAVVASIARTRKPAIVFPWYGGHAQVVTGYKAHGADPATSDDFTIDGVYLTDPLYGYTYIVYGGASHKVVAIDPDTYVSLASWRTGSDAVRYTDYLQTDSKLRDPIDGAIGKLEWYRKWVAVLAV
jgi:hypothetical protein